MRKSAIFMSGLFFFNLMTPTSLATFEDVFNSNMYSDGIHYLQKKGAISGYPDGTFKPFKTINRAEFTKIVVEVLYDEATIKKCTNSTFSDIPANAWFIPYVCMAKTNGIIDGYPDETFRPENDILVVEAAKILINAFDYETEADEDNVWYRPYIKAMANLNHLPISLSELEHKITRAEMAEMTYRSLLVITYKPSTSLAHLQTKKPLKPSEFKEFYNDATKYKDHLMGLSEIVTIYYKAYTQLTEAIESRADLEMIEFQRFYTLEELGELLIWMNQIDGYKSDLSLRNVLISKIKTRMNILHNEQKELIETWVKMSDKSNPSKELIEKENELMKTIQKKIDANQLEIESIQNSFIKKWQ